MQEEVLSLNKPEKAFNNVHAGRYDDEAWPCPWHQCDTYACSGSGDLLEPPSSAQLRASRLRLCWTDGANHSLHDNCPDHGHAAQILYGHGGLQKSL